jgi:predicted nuclease of predicted toxin-antitoxin system
MLENKPDLKLLFDVGVSKKAEVHFKKLGFDVLGIRNINASMKDTDIMDLAVKEGRLIITMDKDFGELVFNSKKLHSGVLLLRMEDANWKQKIDVLSEIFNKHSKDIAGKFSVYQDKKLRIR